MHTDHSTRTRSHTFAWAPRDTVSSQSLLSLSTDARRKLNTTQHTTTKSHVRSAAIRNAATLHHTRTQRTRAKHGRLKATHAAARCPQIHRDPTETSDVLRSERRATRHTRVRPNHVKPAAVTCGSAALCSALAKAARAPTPLHDVACAASAEPAARMLRSHALSHAQHAPPPPRPPLQPHRHPVPAASRPHARRALISDRLLRPLGGSRLRRLLPTREGQRAPLRLDDLLGRRGGPRRRLGGGH